MGLFSRLLGRSASQRPDAASASASDAPAPTPAPAAPHTKGLGALSRSSSVGPRASPKPAAPSLTRLDSSAASQAGDQGRKRHSVPAAGLNRLFSSHRRTLHEAVAEEPKDEPEPVTEPPVQEEHEQELSPSPVPDSPPQLPSLKMRDSTCKSRSSSPASPDETDAEHETPTSPLPDHPTVASLYSQRAVPDLNLREPGLDTVRAETAHKQNELQSFLKQRRHWQPTFSQPGSPGAPSGRDSLSTVPPSTSVQPITEARRPSDESLGKLFNFDNNQSGPALDLGFSLEKEEPPKVPEETKTEHKKSRSSYQSSPNPPSETGRVSTIHLPWRHNRKPSSHASATKGKDKESSLYKAPATKSQEEEEEMEQEPTPTLGRIPHVSLSGSLADFVFNPPAPETPQQPKESTYVPTVPLQNFLDQPSTLALQPTSSKPLPRVPSGRKLVPHSGPVATATEPLSPQTTGEPVAVSLKGEEGLIKKPATSVLQSETKEHPAEDQAEAKEAPAAIANEPIKEETPLIVSTEASAPYVDASAPEHSSAPPASEPVVPTEPTVTATPTEPNVPAVSAESAEPVQPAAPHAPPTSVTEPASSALPEQPAPEENIREVGTDGPKDEDVVLAPATEAAEDKQVEAAQNVQSAGVEAEEPVGGVDKDEAQIPAETTPAPGPAGPAVPELETAAGTTDQIAPVVQPEPLVHVLESANPLPQHGAEETVQTHIEVSQSADTGLPTERESSQAAPKDEEESKLPQPALETVEPKAAVEAVKPEPQDVQPQVAVHPEPDTTNEPQEERQLRDETNVKEENKPEVEPKSEVKARTLPSVMARAPAAIREAYLANQASSEPARPRPQAASGSRVAAAASRFQSGVWPPGKKPDEKGEDLPSWSRTTKVESVSAATAKPAAITPAPESLKAAKEVDEPKSDSSAKEESTPIPPPAVAIERDPAATDAIVQQEADEVPVETSAGASQQGSKIEKPLAVDVAPVDEIKAVEPRTDQPEVEDQPAEAPVVPVQQPEPSEQPNTLETAQLPENPLAPATTDSTRAASSELTRGDQNSAAQAPIVSTVDKPSEVERQAHEPAATVEQAVAEPIEAAHNAASSEAASDKLALEGEAPTTTELTAETISTPAPTLTLREAPVPLPEANLKPSGTEADEAQKKPASTEAQLSEPARSTDSPAAVKPTVPSPATEDLKTELPPISPKPPAETATEPEPLATLPNNPSTVITSSVDAQKIPPTGTETLVTEPAAANDPEGIAPLTPKPLALSESTSDQGTKAIDTAPDTTTETVVEVPTFEKVDIVPPEVTADLAQTVEDNEASLETAPPAKTLVPEAQPVSSSPV